MRTYVSTLGYHAERVTRPVIKQGVGAGDEVVVVRPDDEDDDGRAEEAVDHVRRLLGEVEPDATIAVQRVDTSEFGSAVVSCSDVLLAAEGDVIVNFGGGAREVFLPLTVATLVHAPRVTTALQFTDVDGTVREWTVPNLTARVAPNEWSTLAAIADADGTITVPELTDVTDKSKSTVSRHVARFDQQGLVETWTDDRTKVAELTTAGRLLLRTDGPDR